MNKTIKFSYNIESVPYGLGDHLALEEFIYEINDNLEEQLLITTFDESFSSNALGGDFTTHQDPQDISKAFHIVLNIWQPSRVQTEDGKHLSFADDPDPTLMVRADHYFSVSMHNSEPHVETVPLEIVFIV
jgi:hypothetical protein